LKMNKKKTLVQKFIEFNALHRLAGKKKRCLLAVSGGIDSVVMAELFDQVGFPFAIAHCDFGLRGEESKAEVRFVKNLANRYRVKIFVKAFETEKYAAEKKVSIQVAARELRYAWFEELRQKYEFDLVATAHHLNDNIETIIYNLAKGTGIRGLRGIPVRNSNIIRPLLFASRTEIEKFQQENKLAFCEDSSNAEDKYARNKIRHAVIPVLKEINPALEDAFAEKIEIFSAIEQVQNRKLKQLNKQLFVKRGDDIYIPLFKLKKIEYPQTALFEYLKEFDFNKEQVEDMLASMDAPAGKQFISDKARIIKDRRFFILTQLPASKFDVNFIDDDTIEIELTGTKLLISKENAEGFKIAKSQNVACIDRHRLHFPLILRPWKAGDYFYPFGMGMKKKKLKKFFVDTKVPLNEKEQVLVLESDKKIVWVVGYRLDERFKITPQTKEVLKLQFKETRGESEGRG
jgi:tRNA(Ile)-lysidine synthase